MKNRQNKLIHVPIAVALMLFIISFSVVFTLAWKPLYYMDMKILNISEESGYPEDEIRANYNAVIDYNLEFGDSELEFPTFSMSEGGKIHFEEVKDIFNLFKYLCIITFVVSVFGIRYMKKKKEYLYLKLTSILTVIIPMILGIFVAVNWDRAFILFHELCFDNDYWIFDPVTDPVITILPDEFFLHCAVLILACVVFGSVLCGILYRRSARKA